MKTRILATAATAFTLALAPAAYAQDDAAAASEAADAAAAPDSASQQFSDTQIAGFVNALGEVQKIQADASLDAQTKQTQMASAIQAAGLDVETFNAIANQAQSDPALKQKIDEQSASHQATP